MVILKKIKAATLIETLTASVLIVIIFMMASLSINSVFRGTIAKDVSAIEAKVQELYYLQLHDKLKLPYEEAYLSWQILVNEENNKVKIYYSSQDKSKEFVYPKENVEE